MIHTLRYGLISALQASSLYIGKILVQGSVNTLGTPGIAAYTAATRIEGFAKFLPVTAEEMRSPSWSPRILGLEIMTG